MIRHAFNITGIEAEITALDATWLQKAANRTKKLVAIGQYKEASSIWSTVKPVFMKLQHNKCVFCEQQLEGGVYGPVAWDLEHFRPKSNVAVWPDPGRHANLHYPGLGAASKNGYYWLAYSLKNYAASCKVCNTIFKLNWFPVSAARSTPATVPITREQPLLCYPLGTIDDDPEDLVTFVLTTAIPKHQVGAQNLRGKIIIDFFGLNIRDKIHKDRAQMIGSVGALLSDRDRGTASDEVLAFLTRLRDASLPHAACVRAFNRLWDADPATARRGYELCRIYGFDPSTAPPTL